MVRWSAREPLISSRKMIRKVSCGQRTRAGGQGLGDDLVFARGRPDLESLVVLDLADLRDDLRAAIEQADEVLIEPVDLAPASSPGSGGACESDGFGAGARSFEPRAG